MMPPPPQKRLHIPAKIFQPSRAWCAKKGKKGESFLGSRRYPADPCSSDVQLSWLQADVEHTIGVTYLIQFEMGGGEGGERSTSLRSITTLWESC